MGAPISISIPHQLGRAEARRRIENGFAGFAGELPGGRVGSQRWDGDRLSFNVAALGQSIAGVIDVLDTSVTIQIELPGVLGMLASGLRARLQRAGQLLLTRR